MISPRYVFTHEPNASKDNVVVKNSDDNLVVWQERDILLEGIVSDMTMSVKVESEFFDVKQADLLIKTLYEKYRLTPTQYNHEKIKHLQNISKTDDAFVIISAVLHQAHKNGAKSATKLPLFLYVFNELGKDNIDIAKNIIQTSFEDYLKADFESALVRFGQTGTQKSKDWQSLAILIGVIVALLAVGIMSSKKEQESKTQTSSQVQKDSSSNVAPVQTSANTLLGSQVAEQKASDAGSVIAEYGEQQRAQYTDPKYHAELTRLAKEETLAKIGIDTKKMQEDMSCWVN